MVTRTFAPGEVILQQGIITQNVWLLLMGACEVIKEPASGSLGDSVKLAEMTAHETFGEMTMFAAAPHCTSVWAITAVTTLKLSRADFDRLAQTHAATTCRLVCNLVNILSERLRRMDEWITRLLDEHETAVAEEQWLKIRKRLQETFQGHLF
jgi:CRP-like cAMP-binding protein